MTDPRAITTGTNADFSMRLSWPMQRVLFALLNNRSPWDHCRKQADYGGMVSTMVALRKRGLIDNDDRLTAAGRKLARHLSDESAAP